MYNSFVVESCENDVILLIIQSLLDSDSVFSSQITAPTGTNPIPATEACLLNWDKLVQQTSMIILMLHWPNPVSLRTHL